MISEIIREVDGITYYMSERYPRVGDHVHYVEYSDDKTDKIGKIVRKAADGLFDIEVTGIKRTIPREWITVVDEIEDEPETVASLAERIRNLETRMIELERLVSYE